MSSNVEGHARETGSSRIGWRTSTRSDNAGGNCVEAGPVADATGRVAVRHSRHPDGRMFVYDRAAWVGLLVGAKADRFDFTT